MIATLYLPVRVIWRCGDDTDSMPLDGKISSQFSGIFSGSGKFGMEVKTNDKDFHQGILPILFNLHFGKQKVALDSYAILSIK